MSTEPATPRAVMPSYTQILINGMVLSDIARVEAILPSRRTAGKDQAVA